MKKYYAKPEPPKPTTKYMYTYTNTEVMLSTNLIADKEPIYPSKIEGKDLTKGKYNTATSVSFKSSIAKWAKYETEKDDENT